MHIIKKFKYLSIFVLLLVVGFSFCFATNKQDEYFGISDEGEGIYRLLKLVVADSKTPLSISYISDETIIGDGFIVDGRNADDVIRETFYDGKLSKEEAKSFKKIFSHFHSIKFQIIKSTVKEGSLTLETEKNRGNKGDYFVKFKGKWIKETISGDITVYDSDKDKYPSCGVMEMVLVK